MAHYTTYGYQQPTAPIGRDPRMIGGVDPMFGSSSPTQMETSGYLPAYLLGGPSSPSAKVQTKQRLTQASYFYSPQRYDMSPSKSRGGSSAINTGRNQLYNGEKKLDTKPGGPPVQSLQEHTSSPARTNAPLVAAGTSPERRQLTFTGFKTIYRGTPIVTPNTPTVPTITPGPVENSSHTGPSSPTQMDPFYSQGEQLTSQDTYNEHWVTVFGFPPAATSYILEQFSQYGTILKHEIASEGNWMHIYYQTKLQAKKALSKNGKVYSDGIMVGVQPCIAKNVIDKYPAPTPTTTPTHTPGSLTPHRKPPSMRPLTAAYQASSLSHDVAPINANTPQKSTGFLSRTMEYVFGW